MMDLLSVVQDVLIRTKKQFDKIYKLMDTPREVDYVNLLKAVIKCRKLLPKELNKQYDRVVVVSADDIDEQMLVELMLVALVNACSVKIYYETEAYYPTYTFFRTLFNRFAKNLHMSMPFVIVKHNTLPKVYDFRCEKKNKNLMKDFMQYIVSTAESEK